MPKKFPGGVHPAQNKITREDSIVELTPPAKVYVPIIQHIGKPACLKVQVGDSVKMGTLLASSECEICANVFSPVSGKVMGIENRLALNGENVCHIVIDNDFLDTIDYLPRINNPSADQIIKRVADCGIVGMGGAGFPTAVKLSPPKDDKIDIFLINGAECEPYITADHRVMIEYPEQIIKGAKYMSEALGAKKIIIGIESNKPDAVASLNKAIQNNNYSDISVVPLQVKYPQGAEKQLIYSLTKRKVPAMGLPSNVGVIVQNVHTVLAVYFAIAEGQPLFRRVVTVSGGAIKNKGNYWIRTGTAIKDIIEVCKFTNSRENIKTTKDKLKEKQSYYDGLSKESKDEKKKTFNEIKLLKQELKEKQESECATVLNGGPMMGNIVEDEQISVTKTTSAVLFLTQKEINMHQASQCINCGKCAMVCPMKLMPMFIDSACIAGDWAESKKYGAVDCILCGCCSYICPAKRPLVTSMRKSKKMIAKRGL